MKFNQYTLTARVLPAILVSLPFQVLYYFFISPMFGEFTDSVLQVKWIGDLSVSLALVVLLIQANRVVSKELFEKFLFKSGLELPSVSYLLHSNTYYTTDFTKSLHGKIKKDFGINIPTESEEALDDEKSRRCISEAVALIRIKAGNGKLIHQHNMEYGFIRNLVGGSTIATAMSLVNIFIFTALFPNDQAFIISLLLLWVYLIVVVLGKWLITKFSHSYAVVLIQEYLAK